MALFFGALLLPRLANLKWTRSLASLFWNGLRVRGGGGWGGGGGALVLVMRWPLVGSVSLDCPFLFAILLRNLACKSRPQDVVFGPFAPPLHVSATQLQSQRAVVPMRSLETYVKTSMANFKREYCNRLKWAKKHINLVLDHVHAL